MPNTENTSATGKRKDQRVEHITVGIVLFVIAVVPLLTFLFSFGNVGDLGTQLGVDRRIAYLTGPGVDLTATGMIVAATWLSHKGATERELWRIHALSATCALIMFALNCGPAAYAHRYQLAAFNAVGPFLLMAMGYVGPWLLRQLTADGLAAQVPSAAGVPMEAPTAGTPSAPPTAPIPADDKAPPTAPEAPTAPPTRTPTRPPSAPAVGTRTADRTADIIDMSSAGAAVRRPLAAWVEHALPLYRRHAGATGAPPTAPQLAALLAEAGHGRPGDSRARDVRAATARAAEDARGAATGTGR